MTATAVPMTTASQDRPTPTGLQRSMSSKLLVLTVLFVMIAEVLIFTPSVARYREAWMAEKLAAGHLAALALSAAPERMVTPALERELLAHVGAYRIEMIKGYDMAYRLSVTSPPPADLLVRTDESNVVSLVIEAFQSISDGAGRTLEVRGPSPRDPAVQVHVRFDETPLHRELIDFGWRIAGLSLAISLITASLVFLSLRWLIVRPIEQITDRMVAFRGNPDDPDAIIRPSTRSDELGVAERELHAMQSTIRQSLRQQGRLAALGTAVVKINHDLRNLLSTASLGLERLSMSDDPSVKQSGERVLDTLDRAVELCGKTLDYTRDDGPTLNRIPTDLFGVAQSALDDLEEAKIGSAGHNLTLINKVPKGLVAPTDCRELRRAMINLLRNAVEAGSDRLTIGAEVGDRSIDLLLRDNGPGLPPRARQHLFQPFAGSARPGGTGLGLAIAREVLVAHRGALTLDRTGPEGTVFRLTLPKDA